MSDQNRSLKPVKRQTPVRRQTLAEQVAESIQESILAGDWQPGEALPTEPDLSEAFGVSRAVIRDATRMLAAQGLVQAQHGRGVFVTPSQVAAFGDALLLALRRAGATVWDVEQFEQLIFPEVCALAAVMATAEELAGIQKAVDDYLALYGDVLTAYWDEENWPESERQQTTAAYRRFIQSVFEATHNLLLALLAEPLLRLRSTRDWQPPEEHTLSAEHFARSERSFLQQIVDAIATHDAQKARQTVKTLMQLPPEAEEAMQQTLVGETPVIRGRFEVD